MNKYFAEVIESSLESWLAQSWNWDIFPDFGSILIVESEDKNLFAIVYQIQTGSIDSSRQAFAYQKTEEELKREQPQIFEFLRTTFSCLILGYQREDKIFYNLAPRPAKIHSFIRKATQQEILDFLSSPQYLQILFASSNKVSNLDELLLALLYSVKQINIEQIQLDELIETFSLLTCNDYRRLKLFLQRLDNL